MESKGVGAVVVVEGSRPVGIMTDRDIVRRGVAHGLSEDVRVDGIMSSPVVTIDADADLRHAFEILHGHAVRRLVMIRDGAVEIVEAGIIGPDVRRRAGESDELRVRFRWRGREAVLYNLHLRSYGAAKPWRDPRLDVLAPRTWLPYLRQYRDAVRARAREVERLAEHIDRETLPVIVAGDFNEGPFTWAYRRLSRVPGGGRRTDAFHAAGRGDGRTYHGRRPVVRIDFVLADSAFEVVDAYVPASTFSDHRPVVVRLRWNELSD